MKDTMPTESDKNQQTGKKSTLTPRQYKIISEIVAGSNYTDACEKIHINRATFYAWLKIPEFTAELNRQRSELVSDAFGVLSQSITRAVEVLTALLDTKDERIKRLAANDIIEHILQHKEIEDLQQRITAIESRLAEKPN